jgi:hypothetical protein
MQILLIDTKDKFFEIEGNLEFVGAPELYDLSYEIELWDAIAAKAGVTLLSQFFFPPINNRYKETYKAICENTHHDSYEGPPIPQRFPHYSPDDGPWFSPEDGLRTVREVLNYSKEMESGKIKGAGKRAQLHNKAIAARYYQDFKSLKGLLEGALTQSPTAKFRLTTVFMV